MNREKAIEILTRIMNNNFYGGEVQMACKMAIEALSKPSLPSNLDEAAEKFARDDAARMWDIENKTEEEIVKAAFKAGAELMAGQGETHEHYVIREVAGHDIGPAIVSYPETFEIGDKVVVQIRKK